MSLYDDIAAENRRQAVLAMMGNPVPSQAQVTVPKPSKTVPLQPQVVPLPSGERKQARWNKANAGRYRAWRTEYMREYRKRKASDGTERSVS